MNIWILIGIILLIFLTAFGRNPMEEAHKRHELAILGKDPLIYKTEEYLKSKQKGGLGGLISGGAESMSGGAPLGAAGAAQPGYPGYRGRKSAALIPQFPDPDQNYYPPPPETKNEAHAPALPTLAAPPAQLPETP